jgi:pimeloyl-ACP methyl ester carboxylesterase
MEKIAIKNRKNQKIVVLLEKTENAKGLAFIMHGLGGNKEEPHIKIFAEAFTEKDFTVVRFDTTNTFGESDGTYKDATLTNYFGDLEDVINWAKSNDWYQEPFYLVGHSFGGISTTLYAEKYPEKVKALAPISSVVSGKLTAQAPYHKNALAAWEKTGWKEDKSISVPGRVKRLPWSHMLDRYNYDILVHADRLKMPVLLIVGDRDMQTPLEHQQLFFEALTTNKAIHIIKGAGHVFNQEVELAEIKTIFTHWIEKVESRGK